jgi:dTDP-glucose 4,6-dehydratase
MYAADMALWLLTILFKGTSGRPYNVGSDIPISISELADEVASIKKPPLEVRIMQSETGVLPPRYVPSVEQARGELGLKLHFNLHEAIASTIQWHESERIFVTEG